MSEERDDTVLIEDDESKSENESIIIVEDDPAEEAVDDDDRVSVEVDDDDDSEREAIRQRRRKEKVDRKERRETAIKRDKTELDFLRGRNDDLERRLTDQEPRARKQDQSGFDQAIAQANKEIGMADRVIAKAVEDNNGQDVAKAMKYRDEAKTKAEQLNYRKQQIAQQEAQQAASPPVDDRTMHFAKQFMEDNPRYDSTG